MKLIIRVTAIFLLTFTVAKAQDLIFSAINVSQGLSDNQIRYIIQLPDGRMVFKTSGNLNIYDGAHFKYLHQDAGQLYPLSAYDGFYRIYQSRDSILWIKDSHKLMCVDLRTEKYVQDLGSYFRKIGFKTAINDVFVDARKRLWLLTDGKLLLEDHSLALDISAHEGTLQDLATEKNNLYLFYHTGTVVCYDLKTKRKRYSIAAYPAMQQAKFGRTSLVVEGKNGFYQLRNGSMGGFFFFDIRNRSWRKILETSYTLNTLVVNAEGTASISCANGIWVIDFGSGKKRYLPLLKKTDGTTLNTEISTIFYDKQDGLWLGTVNQGLLYYHPSRYTFTHVGRSQFQKTWSKDIVVQSFAEDHSGNIYLKCQSEIYRYHPTTKNNILSGPITPSFLPQEISEKFRQKTLTDHLSNEHRAELTDIHGRRWIGTADGLKVIDPQTKTEQFFYTRDGLSNNFIHALLQDRHQNIWITTSYGINKVQAASDGKINFIKFGPEEGTLKEEYTDGSAFESANGTLYFGGINGFSILEPKTLKQKRLPFKPVFSKLFLRGEKVEIGKRYDGRIILQKSAAYTQCLELSHDQNFLTFEFSALNYQNPSQTYYRYQLEGIDKNWIETYGREENGNMATAGILTKSYTNLPHGKYRLRILSSNNNRDWKAPATVLQLTIHAPWYKTTLACILFISFSLLLVFAMLFIYLRYTRRKLERIHREDILLLRIRNLIDQCNNLQAEKESQQGTSHPDSINSEPDTRQNQTESAFLAKALMQVEKNLHVSNYSVEQLSRDLHMDRTGLYRKLITLLDKSPSLFIRNVRLEKAAALILEGELNISEITERVGFSSSSYLSKCFQERYGCRPSEYVEKTKKST